jgi:hypothetical protein
LSKPGLSRTPRRAPPSGSTTASQSNLGMSLKNDISGFISYSVVPSQQH